MPGLSLLRCEPGRSDVPFGAVATAKPKRAADTAHALEHAEHLRPYRHSGEKQAQRGQRDCFFQD